MNFGPASHVTAHVNPTPLTQHEEVSMVGDCANGKSSVSVILALAQAQYGLVTRRELLRAGLSHDTVRRHVRSGLLRRLHAGVYQVGPVAAEHTRERAAMLACRGGIVSRQSALSFRQLAPPESPGAPVQVIVRSHCGRRPGIVAHREELCDDEITLLHGIRVTSIARTLLDVSGMLASRDLEQAVARAQRADPKIVDHVRMLLQRYPGRGGTPALRNYLDGTAAYTASVLEEKTLNLILEGGLPKPLLNVRRFGMELDCYWPDAGVALELDGYEYHRTRQEFERDHRRDTALAAHGIQVLRFSWLQITKQPIRSIAEIAQALARAPRKS
jgi:hypothetical protein